VFEAKRGRLSGNVAQTERTIRKVIVRKYEYTDSAPGHYTTGWVDPEKHFNFVVEVSNGQVSGFGECIPCSLIYPAGTPGIPAFDEWKRLTQIAQSLLGKDAGRLRRLIPPELDAEDGASVADALDFALHDFVGRLYGIPVAQLLGGSAKNPIRWMKVIHTGSVDEMTRKAEMNYRKYGIRTFKLKPKGELDFDREVMTRIRERTSQQVRFYIDPNHGLKMDVEQVIAYINGLAQAGLDVCEDPIDADFATYRRIREKTTARLMIDAKAHTLADVLRIIEFKCADMINIHADWASGFQPAIQKAMLAAHAGMGVIIGSTDYIGIGNAAYHILASVLPGDYPCEQSVASAYTNHVVVENEFAVRDGLIHIPDAPGLGIDVITDKLDAGTVEKVALG